MGTELLRYSRQLSSNLNGLYGARTSTISKAGPVGRYALRACLEQAEAEVAAEAKGNGAGNRRIEDELPETSARVGLDQAALAAEAMEMDGTAMPLVDKEFRRLWLGKSERSLKSN